MPDLEVRPRPGEDVVVIAPSGTKLRKATNNDAMTRARVKNTGTWVEPVPEPPPPPPPPPEPTGTPVGANLQAAIDAAPVGASLYLTQDVTVNGRVYFNRKQGLTLDGRGRTIKVNGASNVGLFFQGCRDIRIIGAPVIVGSATMPGVYIPGTEHAHAVHVNGGQGYEFVGLDLRNFQGDGYYFAQDGNTPGSNAVIRGGRVADNGRMGVAVVAWRGLRVEGLDYHNMGFRPIDLEPDQNGSYQQIAADCTFIGGVSTGWNGRFPDPNGTTLPGHPGPSKLVDASAIYLGTPYTISSGYPPVISNIVIDGLVVRDGMTGIRTIFEGRGYRVTDVVIRNCRGEKQAAGIGNGGWVHGTGADRVQVLDNYQPVPSGAYAVALADSTGVVASGNTGAGLAGQVKP
jgi:hypothetical protein